MGEGLRETITAARRAGLRLGTMPAADRTRLLNDVADAYAAPENQRAVFAANAEDMAEGRREQERGTLAAALVDRLALDAKKMASLVDGLRQMARAPEVIGRVTLHRELDRDLVLRRVTCPLGVIGVVFEARPDALVQITGLAIKSGNAVILKGGKEALGTNRALLQVLHAVLQRYGIDPSAAVLVADRADVATMLAQRDLIDLMVARGSSEFIRYVRANTKIPVMAHADGICHVYLHAAADAGKAEPIVIDAKTSYPAACNTVETLLWDEGAAPVLDRCVKALLAAGVELRGCEDTRRRHPDLKGATEADWDTEYGALILSIRKVADLDAAIAHIARHGSRHTDAIVTEDGTVAARFLAEVDSACCFHNASTRFADGYRFGLGAEVGISTDKLHARGPVGVEGLVTYRWLLVGAGQATTEYGEGEGKRRFTHRDLP